MVLLPKYFNFWSKFLHKEIVIALLSIERLSEFGDVVCYSYLVPVQYHHAIHELAPRNIAIIVDNWDESMQMSLFLFLNGLAIAIFLKFPR